MDSSVPVSLLDKYTHTWYVIVHSSTSLGTLKYIQVPERNIPGELWVYSKGVHCTWMYLDVLEDKYTVLGCTYMYLNVLECT